MELSKQGKNKLKLVNSFEQTYPITFIENEQDVTPNEISLTKNQIFELFTNHQIVEDKSTLAFIPGTFIYQSTRSTEAVRNISLLVYDVDCKDRYYSLRDLQEKFADYTCVIHSTYNAAYEHPRWRVILLLDQAIEPENFDFVYRTIGKELDLEYDLACTNINRLFYLPSAHKHNDFVYSWSNDASVIPTKDYIAKNPQQHTQSNEAKKKRIKTSEHRIRSLSSESFQKFKSKQFVEGLKRDGKKICGFEVPVALKAPFTQEEFDLLLSHPGSWLTAARYLGLPTEGISTERPYSKSFSSVIPGVEDAKPSCSLALLSSGGRTRLAYQAFNELHSNSNATGPVIIDLARIYAMLHSRRRIEQDAFPKATHKAWLVRLMINCGMIIPTPVEDLPDLPAEAKQAAKLYTGFRELLMCKRAFKEQVADATAFSLTFACYWCQIGNRNTVKKYTAMLLEHKVFRFVDKLSLPNGASIPLLMPAGKTAKIYSLKNRKGNVEKQNNVQSLPESSLPVVPSRADSNVVDITSVAPGRSVFNEVTDEVSNIETVRSRQSTRYLNGGNNTIGKGRGPSRLTEPVSQAVADVSKSNAPYLEKLIHAVRQQGKIKVKLEVLLAEAGVSFSEEVLFSLPAFRNYIEDYDPNLQNLLFHNNL